MRSYLVVHFFFLNTFFLKTKDYIYSGVCLVKLRVLTHVSQLAYIPLGDCIGLY